MPPSLATIGSLNEQITPPQKNPKRQKSKPNTKSFFLFKKLTEDNLLELKPAWFYTFNLIYLHITSQVLISYFRKAYYTGVNSQYENLL